MRASRRRRRPRRTRSSSTSWLLQLLVARVRERDAVAVVRLLASQPALAFGCSAAMGRRTRRSQRRRTERNDGDATAGWWRRRRRGCQRHVTVRRPRRERNHVRAGGRSAAVRRPTRVRANGEPIKRSSKPSHTPGGAGAGGGERTEQTPPEGRATRATPTSRPPDGARGPPPAARPRSPSVIGARAPASGRRAARRPRHNAPSVTRRAARGAAAALGGARGDGGQRARGEARAERRERRRRARPWRARGSSEPASGPAPRLPPASPAPAAAFSAPHRTAGAAPPPPPNAFDLSHPICLSRLRSTPPNSNPNPCFRQLRGARTEEQNPTRRPRGRPRATRRARAASHFGLLKGSIFSVGARLRAARRPASERGTPASPRTRRVTEFPARREFDPPVHVAKSIRTPLEPAEAISGRLRSSHRSKWRAAVALG